MGWSFLSGLPWEMEIAILASYKYWIGVVPQGQGSDVLVPADTGLSSQTASLLPVGREIEGISSTLLASIWQALISSLNQMILLELGHYAHIVIYR